MPSFARTFGPRSVWAIVVPEDEYMYILCATFAWNIVNFVTSPTSKFLEKSYWSMIHMNTLGGTCIPLCSKTFNIVFRQNSHLTLPVPPLVRCVFEKFYVIPPTSHTFFFKTCSTALVFRLKFNFCLISLNITSFPMHQRGFSNGKSSW